MIRISRKADYAIVLLSHLAQAWRDARDGCPPLSASELARRCDLSQAVVANLLKDYARASLLESVRGQSGGYRLAQAPGELSLRRILSVVEGPIHFVDCAGSPAPAGHDGELCDLAGSCPSQGPMLVLHNKIVTLLDELSLAELSAHPERVRATFEAQTLPR